MQDYLQLLGQTAQILHLNGVQFKLAHELNCAQVVLDKTIALVNEHSYILRNDEHALRAIMSQNSVFKYQTGIGSARCRNTFYPYVN